MYTELPPVDARITKMALDLLNAGKKKAAKETVECYRCKKKLNS